MIYTRTPIYQAPKHPWKQSGMRSLNQLFLEGQIIVVQAADLQQTRKIIPDFATWVQCFSLYSATLASKFPERIQELMTYQTTIAKASRKYRWPSWVVYDQNFRQEVAGNPSQSWAKVDPRVYASNKCRKLVYKMPVPRPYLRQLPVLAKKEAMERGNWSRCQSVN